MVGWNISLCAQEPSDKNSKWLFPINVNIGLGLAQENQFNLFHIQDLSFYSGIDFGIQKYINANDAMGLIVCSETLTSIQYSFRSLKMRYSRNNGKGNEIHVGLGPTINSSFNATGYSLDVKFRLNSKFKLSIRHVASKPQEAFLGNTSLDINRIATNYSGLSLEFGGHLDNLIWKLGTLFLGYLIFFGS